MSARPTSTTSPGSGRRITSHGRSQCSLRALSAPPACPGRCHAPPGPPAAPGPAVPPAPGTWTPRCPWRSRRGTTAPSGGRAPRRCWRCAARAASWCGTARPAPTTTRCPSGAARVLCT
ncbi:hypothetical protein RLOC_00015063 [Lonchura striata]|uniref:Uncharacterized protein n=1 Tax=Lonchura striata TaxID=40157 RepID=A0A218UAT9_9PASE|nr:hypothetical protein RLOC_00015063 [Lonchura striata domestica]